MALIDVKKLSAFYENKEIFKGLTFSVEKGDYLCILGENGSGKTTLMRCILGLPVKHTGEIEYNGISNGDIGWLPQRTDTQKDFPASVFEVVFSGFAGKRGSKKDNKKKAFEQMKSLDILHLKDRSFKELSSGQQQRVLLCRALCAAGSVLLLDEPVTGLDNLAEKEMYEIIKRLNKDGVTIIMISHDTERAVFEADKILNISENGYFFGAVSQYLSAKDKG